MPLSPRHALSAPFSPTLETLPELDAPSCPYEEASTSFRSEPWRGESGLLRDERINHCPDLRFNPAHFVTLPAACAVPPSEECAALRPPGANASVANATLLPIGRSAGAIAPSVAQSSQREDGAIGLHLFGRPDVLQMQAPTPDKPGSCAAFTAALLSHRPTDLYLVTTLVPTLVGETVQPGLDQKDSTTPLLDGFALSYRGSDDLTRSAQLDATPLTQDEQSGRMSVAIGGGADGPAPHQLRTHLVDLSQPNWIFAIEGAIRQPRADGEALAPAIVCHDGARASGTVAAAMHAMQCLHDFNAGRLPLQGVDDLVRRTEAFIAEARDRRSPEFAQTRPAMTAERLVRLVCRYWEASHDPASKAVEMIRRDTLPLVQPLSPDGLEVPVGRPTWRASARAPGLRLIIPPPAPLRSLSTSSAGQVSQTSAFSRPSSHDSGVARSPVSGFLSPTSAFSGSRRGSILSPTLMSQGTRSPLRSPSVVPTELGRASPSSIVSLASDAAVARAEGRQPISKKDFVLRELNAWNDAVAMPRDLNSREVETHTLIDWLPDGARSEALLSPAIDQAVKLMTQHSGARGHLRRRLDGHLNVNLRPTLSGLGESVARQFRNEVKVTGPDEQKPGAWIRGLRQAVDGQVRARFAQLTPQEQQRWCARVDKSDSRFARALRHSQDEVDALPRRISGGRKKGQESLRRHYIAMPRMSETTLRGQIDDAWVPHLVLTAMRDVAREHAAR